MDSLAITHAFLEGLKALAWPLTVIFIAFLLKEKIKDIFIKHKDTELRLNTHDLKESKANSEKLLAKLTNKAPEEVRKLQKEINNMYETALAVVNDRAAEVESDSNSFGSHWLYNNGQTVMEIILPPGGLKETKALEFPQNCKKVSAVTIVGEEQPKVVSLTPSSLVLDLGHTNNQEIRVIISGIK